MVNTYQPADLFAGKCHAILCRKWGKRVKGRDWYDLVWYISRNIPLHVAHLQKRLEQTGAWVADRKLTSADIIKLLTDKVVEVDFSAARKEVMPFVKDPDSTQVWSDTFFAAIIPRITFV